MKIRSCLTAILVFILASATYLTKPLPEYIHNDAGLYAYQAQQLLEGIPPYQSVFNGKMPVGTFALLPGVLLAGVMEWNDIHGIQLSFVFVGGLLVALIYLVGVQLTGSKLGSFLGAMYFLSFKYYSTHLFLFDPKVVATVFQTLFLYLLMKRKYVWAGFAVSCSVLAWQPSFVLLLTGAAGCIDRRLVSSFKNLGFFVYGGVLPLIIITAYFASQGALNDFIQATVVYPLAYHYNPTYLELKRFNVFTYLIKNKHLDSTFIHLGVVFFILSTGLHILNKTPNAVRSTILVFISFISVLCWAVWDFGGYPDLSPLLIYPCIGVAMAYQLMVKTNLKNQIIFVGALSLLLAASAVSFNRKLDDRKEFYQHVEHLQSLVDRHAPDGKVMVYGDTQVLALLKLKHPTRYPVGSPGHNQYIEENYPGGVIGWETDFVSQNAGLVLISVPHRSLEHTLKQNGYQRYGSTNRGRTRVYIKDPQKI